MIRSFLKKSKWFLLAGWLVFVYASYIHFWRENVFWGQNILWKSVGEVWFRIFFLGLFLLIGTALGKRILGWLRFEAGSFLESLLFGLGIGLVIFTFFFIGFGLMGILNKWAVNLSLVGMYVIIYPEIKDIIHQVKARFRSLISSRIPPLEIVLVLVVLIAVVFNLAGASVLPSDWDGLGAYLPLAKEWTYLHRLTNIPYINFTVHNGPFNVGILYAMALLVKDAILAKLIHFAFGLLTAVGVYALAKRYFSSRTALFSGSIFYLIPLVSWQSTTAYIDLGFTFYAFLGFYALTNWITSGKRSWLIISAILSGLCLGSKYTGFLWVTLLLAVILINDLVLKKEKFIVMAKTFVLYTVLTGLIGCFWYLRAFIVSGHSVFSLLQLFFKGWLRSEAFVVPVVPEVPAVSVVPEVPMVPEAPGFLSATFSSLVPYLRLPWEMTMHSRGFSDPGAIGLLFLSFLPFLLVSRFRKSGLVRFFLCYAGAYIFFWAWTLPYKRGLLPIFPLLSIIVAYVLNEIFNFHRFLKGALFFLLILTFLFQVFYLAPEGLDKVFQRLSVLVGLKSQEEYILSNEETYRVFHYVNGHLPVDSKLFIMNDPRTFYCERRYVTVILRKGSPLDISSLKNDIEILAELRRAEITHLVVNQNLWNLGHGKRRYGNLLENLKKKHLQVLYDAHGFQIFRILYG